MQNNLNEIMEILNRAYQENKDNPAFIETIRNITPDGTKEYKFYVKSVNIPWWYSSHLSMREMARRAGVSHERIRQIIAARNLPKPPKFKPLHWYGPDLTVEEMSAKSGLSHATIRQDLHRRGLKFKKKSLVINNYENGVYTWYDPKLSIYEMSVLAKKPYSNIKYILLKLNLPFKHVRK